jgi:hypothetical protein
MPAGGLTQVNALKAGLRTPQAVAQTGRRFPLNFNFCYVTLMSPDLPRILSATAKRQSFPVFAASL